MAKQLYRKSFTLPNGKRKWVSAATEEDLERKLLDLRMEANLGIDVTNNITFGEYALRWYRVCKEPNVGINSKNCILNVLNTHLLPHLSGCPIRSITQLQIQFVFNQISDKSRSLNSKVKSVLKEIFDNAIANRIIQISPMVGLSVSGNEVKEKTALTEAQEKAILQTLSKGTTLTEQRAYLFTLLGFKTGLRRGEICGLMLSDFDLQNKTLSVNRAVIWPDNNAARISDSKSKTKTKAALRNIPIPDTAFATISEAIRKTAASGCLYLFHGEDGKMLSMRSLNNLWNCVQKASPVPFTMHEMRHTYCSRLVRHIATGEVDLKTVQYWMGHSDPDVTLKTYSHCIKDEQFASAAEKMRACL